MPAIPFLALAMGLAFSRLPAIAAAVVVAHAVTSWPPLLSTYCDKYAWRISIAPWVAALRLVPEQQYLSGFTEYKTAKILENAVPTGERVFAYDLPAMSYCDRDVVGSWYTAESIRLRQTLCLPLVNAQQRMRRLTFRFPARPPDGIRIVQTAGGSDVWEISELRLFRSGSELPVNHWRLDVQPWPWNAGLAIDRRPITSWRANRPTYAGMYYAVHFDGARRWWTRLYWIPCRISRRFGCAWKAK